MKGDEFLPGSIVIYPCGKEVCFVISHYFQRVIYDAGEHFIKCLSSNNNLINELYFIGDVDYPNWKKL